MALDDAQEAKASFIGAAAHDLGFLGPVTLAEGSKTLWQKDTVLLQAGACH